MLSSRSIENDGFKSSDTFSGHFHFSKVAFLGTYLEAYQIIPRIHLLQCVIKKGKYSYVNPPLRMYRYTQEISPCVHGRSIAAIRRPVHIDVAVLNLYTSYCFGGSLRANIDKRVKISKKSNVTVVCNSEHFTLRDVSLSL